MALPIASFGVRATMAERTIDPLRPATLFGPVHEMAEDPVTSRTPPAREMSDIVMRTIANQIESVWSGGTRSGIGLATTPGP